MYTTNLRKVGGSVMLALPPALLDLLIESGHLVIEPHPRPRYTLDELVAQCDVSALSPEDREWLEAPPVGNEIL